MIINILSTTMRLARQIRFGHSRSNLNFPIAPFHDIQHAIFVHGRASFFHDGRTVGRMIKVSKPPAPAKSSKDGFIVGQGGRTGGESSGARGNDGNVRLAALVVSGQQPIHVGIRIVPYLGPSWVVVTIER